LDTTTGSLEWAVDVGVDEGWHIFQDNVLAISDNNIYVAGNADKKIYALDLETGNILWIWKSYYPMISEYQFEQVDNNIIFVNQEPDFRIANNFFSGDLLFALKTTP